jgi:hypothetical protein
MQFSVPTIRTVMAANNPNRQLSLTRPPSTSFR